MAKAETRPETQEKKGRKDTVRPPADLPDGTPWERMTELTRRLFAVPKTETMPAKKRRTRKHR